MQSPNMSRDDFKQKLMEAIAGDSDDQKAAKGSAMVMFDTIEFVHENNFAESKFDYAEIFNGSRYQSKEDINKQIELLNKVNQITTATIKNTENMLTRLEEELKKAEVSSARIKLELEAAKSREDETKEQTDRGMQRLKNKVALNQSRIKVLNFLSDNFGHWRFKDNFNFDTEAQVNVFNTLIEDVAKNELAFMKLQ